MECTILQQDHQQLGPRRRALCALVTGALLIVCFVLSGCGLFDNKHDYALAHENTLSVVVSVDGAPMASCESANTNELSGYNVAVAQEVARRLDLACSIESGQALTIPDQVQQGTYDVALSLSSLVSDAKGLAMSSAYYIDSQVLVVRQSAAFDQASDLEDKMIAAVAKTEGDVYACSAFDQSNVIVYASVDHCFKALQSGSVQAVVLDRSIAEAYLQQQTGQYKVLERIETGKRFGFVLSSDNEALMSAINDALQAMDEDGTLQKLQEEYL